MLTRGYTFNINLNTQVFHSYSVIDKLIKYYIISHTLDCIDFFVCHNAKITFQLIDVNKPELDSLVKEHTKEEISFIHSCEPMLNKLQLDIRDCLEANIYRFIDRYGKESGKVLNINGMFLNKYTYILAVEVF